MKVAFRVDVNQHTATGHVMRCLSIAEAMRKQGIQTGFITSDTYGTHFVREKGYEASSLNTAWDNLDSEIHSLLDVLASSKVNFLIVDSYHATPSYLHTISRYIRLMYIDDLNSFTCPVTVVLNSNIYAERMNYRDRYKNAKSKLLLGPTYAPLRGQFANVSRSYSSAPKRIFVSSGGSDPYHVVQAFLDEASCTSSLLNAEFCILAGAFTEKLIIPASLTGRVEVYSNVTDMVSLISSCDIAVTAGGSTMYELCSCGIPSVSFSFADNQLMGVHEFDRLDVIPYCGEIRKNKTMVIRNVIEGIEKYMSDGQFYRTHGERMSKIVDGKGAERIVSAIKELGEEG